MHLKVYAQASRENLALRVYFLDPRFKYTEGVMRVFESRAGLKVMSGEATDFIDSFDSNLPLLILGYADEEPVVIKAAELNGTPEDRLELILAGLSDWSQNGPHFKDLITTERNNIYEF